MKCTKCLVSGRVQGVFYRASTREVAKKLAIKGYAANLDDGRVEVLACGDDAAILELKTWLWQGPTHAVVSDVVCEDTPVPKPPPERFETG